LELAWIAALWELLKRLVTELVGKVMLNNASSIIVNSGKTIGEAIGVVTAEIEMEGGPVGARNTVVVGGAEVEISRMEVVELESWMKDIGELNLASSNLENSVETNGEAIWLRVVEVRFLEDLSGTRGVTAVQR
jgi:hypothetical protein